MATAEVAVSTAPTSSDMVFGGAAVVRWWLLEVRCASGAGGVGAAKATSKRENYQNFPWRRGVVLPNFTKTFLGKERACAPAKQAVNGFPVLRHVSIEPDLVQLYLHRVLDRVG